MRTKLDCALSLVLILGLGVARGQDKPKAVEKPDADKVAPAKTEATAPVEPVAPKASPAPAPTEPKVAKGTVVKSGVGFGKFRKSQSPYRITGSIIVPAGKALEIEPGVTILMEGEYPTITVFGQILARGTKDAPITFKSGKSDPKPWDWDRILFRSKTRSFLQHCVIQNSNYGVYAENASLTLANCTFRRNSIHGLFAKNSTITLQFCTFEKGHVAAIMLDRASVVAADQITVTENINGVVCGNAASLDMRNSTISKNSIGIGVRKDASVSLLDTKITNNKTGVYSETEFTQKSMKNVFDNTTNLVVASADEMDKAFKKPAEVTWLAFAKKDEKEAAPEGFKAGFKSKRKPREAFVKVVGNATAGLKYYKPTDLKHPTTKVAANQNRYIDGLQPEFQVFSTGRKYGWDVNLLMDAYRNEWLSGTNPGGVKANLFNLIMNSENNNIVLGHFFQNGSEITVSSRKVLGAKYEGSFLEMGRGEKRFSLTALAGETERSLIVGDHDPDIPNVEIEGGFAKRQQMTGMGMLDAKIIPGLTAGVNVIHSRDMQNSVIRKDLRRSDTTSTHPIQGTTVGLETEYRFFGDKFVARIEGNAGYADSLDPGNFTTMAKANDFSWSNAAAGSFGLGAQLGKTVAEMQVTVVQPEYFTGGNPYLTQDQYQGRLSATHQLNKQASGGIDYQLTVRNASYTMKANESTSPLQNRAGLNGKYLFGKKKPEVGLSYMFYDERYDKYDVVTLDVTDTLEEVDSNGDTLVTIRSSHDTSGEYKSNILKNTISLNVKQPLNFLKSSYVRASYRIQIESDRSNYLDPSEMGERNALQHQINTTVSTRHGKRVTNRMTGKLKLKGEDKGDREVESYEASDRVTLKIIPRKLRLTMEGKYRKDSDAEDKETGSGRITTPSWLRSMHSELKYTLSSKVSATLSGDYEKTYDKTEGSVDNYSVVFGGLSLTYVF